MTNLTSAQHVLHNLHAHCVHYVIHFHSGQMSIMSNHVHLVQIIRHPSCPQNLTCSPASGKLYTLHGKASYPPLSPLTIYGLQLRCWWHTGENMLHGIYNMIYINTDYDRKLIKKHLFHGIDGAVTRWAFGRGAPRHCGSPAALCKIDR